VLYYTDKEVISKVFPLPEKTFDSFLFLRYNLKRQEVRKMSIIIATKDHIKEWTNMALALFPESTFEEEFALNQEILTLQNEIGVLYQKDNLYVGYMHLSIRNDYVNGTDTSPVVFVEAIYVSPDYRKQGIATAFINYAEKYAKEKGITQLASDCLIENQASENFHKRCGFIEKERVICFVKDIV